MKGMHQHIDDVLAAGAEDVRPYLRENYKVRQILKNSKLL